MKKVFIAVAVLVAFLIITSILLASISDADESGVSISSDDSSSAGNSINIPSSESYILDSGSSSAESSSEFSKGDESEDYIDVESGEAVLPETVLVSDDMFSDRDYKTEYEEKEVFYLSLNGASADSDSRYVTIKGSVITITSGAAYMISGTLSDGQLIVDIDKEEKITLIFNNVSINCGSDSAVFIKQADKVFITLAEGSSNTLTVSGAFIQSDDSNRDGVLFSKRDLTINGTGSLTIKNPYGHGIVSKDDMVITDGNYSIECTGHGLEGKDSIRIAGGSFLINSGKDGIHAENNDDTELGYIYISGGSFVINAANDGIDAKYTLQIDGGSFTITTGGGSSKSVSASISAKGIKATGDIILQNGTFTLDCMDDAIHSKTKVFINGGSFEIASGDDGIHADTKVAINGGKINITKSYEGIESSSVDITGGVISIVASDDGINAAGGNDGSGLGGRPGQGGFTTNSNHYIKISGGRIKINALGDGIDANGSLYISGGEVYVSGPTASNNGALDYDITGQITGGTVVAAGSSGMAQNFGTSSTQCSFLYYFTTSKGANTTISLKDQNGNTIATFTPEKQFQTVVISSPEIKIGETYTLWVGTESYSITVSSKIFTVGSAARR